MDGVHQEHDKGYKDLLSHKKTFVEMIRNFVSERWVDDIDELDQKISSSEIVKRLIESISVLKNLTSDQYTVFKR